MKKLIFVLSFAIALISNNAKATNHPYIGFDILYARSHHQLNTATDDVFSCDSICKAYFNGKKTKKESLQYSLNAGYKFNFNDFFVAPEVFFDQLKNNANGFHDSGHDDRYKAYKIDLNYRYGLKANLGYNIYKKLNIFGFWGFANLDYDQRKPSFSVSHNSRKSQKDELSQLFGAGFSYPINDNIVAKLTYDRQSMSLRSTIFGDENSTIKTKLDVFKIGLAYQF